MNPIDFKESNFTLTKPSNLTDEQCKSLRVCNTGEYIVSLWRLSFWERIKVLFVGRVWLLLWSTKTPPPVLLTINYPFFKEE